MRAILAAERRRRGAFGSHGQDLPRRYGPHSGVNRAVAPTFQAIFATTADRLASGEVLLLAAHRLPRGQAVALCGNVDQPTRRLRAARHRNGVLSLLHRRSRGNAARPDVWLRPGGFLGRQAMKQRGQAGLLYVLLCIIAIIVIYLLLTGRITL